MKSKTKLPATLTTSLVAGLLLCAVPSGQAQDLNLRVDWSTVDAGGGATTGGGFTIQSTIGQPDAGFLLYGPGGSVYPQSGDFAVNGGFGGLFTEHAPVNLFRGPLGIYSAWWLNPPQVVVKWPGTLTGWGLETKTNLLQASWTPVNPGAFQLFSNAVDYHYFYVLPPLPPFHVVNQTTNEQGTVTSVTNTVPALQLFRLRQP